MPMYVHAHGKAHSYLGRWPGWPGTDAMILKIFSPKNLAKILAFMLKQLPVFFKKYIIILVFEKNAFKRIKIGKISRKLQS
jgi:hypothetical protein